MYSQIGAIINRTIGWIELDMRKTEGKNLQPASALEIKQEQQTGPAYRAPSAPPTGPAKGYYHDAGVNEQTPYPALTYAEQSQVGIPPSAYATEAMFYSTTAQVAAAAVAGTSLPASSQANPLIAFPSQAAQHVTAQPSADMLWQGRGNTWHDWTTAIADSQDRYSASALLTLGGGSRDPAAPGEPAPPMGPSNDVNGASQGGQWPLILFDPVVPDGS